MNIDDQQFIAFLHTKRYSETYIQSILSFAHSKLSDISNSEILECRDYTLLVQRVLNTRYHHKNSRCIMGRVTLSRLADYLRTEAAA